MSSKVYISILALASTLFLVNVCLSAFAGATEGVIFKSQTGKISDRYPSFTTPSGWAFMIWNIIFLLIGASLVFVVISTVQHFKRRSTHNPIIFSTAPAAVFLLNQILYISWLFIWDNEELTAAAVVLFIMAVTNMTTVALLGINIHKEEDNLGLGKSSRKLWSYRLLVQNSFAVYTAWTVIATLVNLGIALIHGSSTQTDNRVTSMAMLGALAFLVLLWFALDVFLFDRFFRYMITPLIVVVWALTGIVTKLSDLPTVEREHANDLLTFVYVLLSVSATLAIIRIGIAIYRHIRRPQTV